MIHLSPYIRFKTAELENQWRYGWTHPETNQHLMLHPAIQTLTIYAAELHFNLIGKPLVVTSLFRVKTTDSGIHATGCASDVRVHDIDAFDPSGEACRKWEQTIIETRPYFNSPGNHFKSAKVHGVGDNRHNHLQVGPLHPVPPVPNSYIL